MSHFNLKLMHSIAELEVQLEVANESLSSANTKIGGGAWK